MNCICPISFRNVKRLQLIILYLPKILKKYFIYNLHYKITRLPLIVLCNVEFMLKRLIFQNIFTWNNIYCCPFSMTLIFVITCFYVYLLHNILGFILSRRSKVCDGYTNGFKQKCIQKYKVTCHIKSQIQWILNSSKSKLQCTNNTRHQCCISVWWTGQSTANSDCWIK